MIQLLKHPSFIAHVANGLLILVAVILTIKNFTSIKNLELFHLIMLVLLFAAVFGIHGISHLGLEKEYKFDPLNKYLQ